MGAFKQPLLIAFLLFPVLAMMLAMPYIIYQYRRHGSVSLIRTVVLVAFIYYLLNAYFLVILPLPPRESVTTTWRDMIQPIPFKFISDLNDQWIFSLTQPNTYVQGLLQPVFTQLVFNVLLTLPFGVFLRYYFQCSFKKTVIFTFALSLFFELSQLSGLFFIYPGPYRLFDADDLILNTLGGMLGFGLAPLLSLFLPSRSQIDLKSARNATRVSVLRRGIAFILDGMLIQLLVSLIVSLANLKSYVLVNAVVYISYYTIIPLFANHATPGYRIVRIKLESTSTSLSLWQTFIRACLTFVFISKFLDTINLTMDFALTVENHAFALVYLLILAIWLTFYSSYWIYTFFKNPQQYFYDRFTHTIVTPSNIE